MVNINIPNTPSSPKLIAAKLVGAFGVAVLTAVASTGGQKFTEWVLRDKRDKDLDQKTE